MKAICEICGKEIEMPAGHRGVPLKTCSKFCKDEKRRQYQSERRQRLAGSKEPKVPKAPRADLSKAGWPPDTKRCQKCEKLFISESLGRLCPVCIAAKPLQIRPLDEALAEAKAAGYDPEDYGKYKSAKALAKAGPVDVGLVKLGDKELNYDIYKETGFEGDLNEPERVKEDKEVICKECGFDVEPKYDDEGWAECPACESIVPDNEIEDLFEPDDAPKSPAAEKVEDIVTVAFRLPTRKPRYEFITAIEDLLHLIETYGIDPEKGFPLAADILKNGFILIGEKQSAANPFDLPAMPADYTDPAWGFDRKARV